MRLGAVLCHAVRRCAVLTARVPFGVPFLCVCVTLGMGSHSRCHPTPHTHAETTDSRIQWFSIFSIVILLAVATWQVVFLKQFFRSKKLL